MDEVDYDADFGGLMVKCVCYKPKHVDNQASLIAWYGIGFEICMF